MGVHVQDKINSELTKHGVYTSIVLWVVRNLCILAEHDFAACGDHTELRPIDLDYCPLRQDAKLSIHR